MGHPGNADFAQELATSSIHLTNDLTSDLFMAMQNATFMSGLFVADLILVPHRE